MYRSGLVTPMYRSTEMTQSVTMEAVQKMTSQQTQRRQRNRPKSQRRLITWGRPAGVRGEEGEEAEGGDGGDAHGEDDDAHEEVREAQVPDQQRRLPLPHARLFHVIASREVEVGNGVGVP